MEVKKTKKADLENKKLLFTEIGLIAALGIVLFALEWTTKDSIDVSEFRDTTVVAAEEEIINTEEQKPEEPPAPKQQEPVLSDEIDIVEDDVKIEDEFFNFDDNEFDIEIKDYVGAGDVEEEVIEEEAIPFQLVEEKPTFNGGDANEFSKWVNQRLVYPEIAKENGVQGRVTLQFTVEKDGSVTKVKVLRGVDPSLDQEAVRVVQSSPKWKPGKQRDRAVPVTYTFPVIFQLR
ncbi:MAG: TonB family protein [Bacteroidales bacterium]|nr:TonB family protein [Bacteroidales bacterium]MCF0185120.1 TonB family protein [Bacteroidaceae bacterium]